MRVTLGGFLKRASDSDVGQSRSHCRRQSLTVTAFLSRGKVVLRQNWCHGAHMTRWMGRRGGGRAQGSNVIRKPPCVSALLNALPSGSNAVASPFFLLSVSPFLCSFSSIPASHFVFCPPHPNPPATRALLTPLSASSSDVILTRKPLPFPR